MKIVSALKEIGTSVCIEKAKSIEASSGPLRSLHLRSAKLSEQHAISLAKCFAAPALANLTSLSLSYNPIGDEGAIALANVLPETICEIGLVSCGISDEGGSELLKRIHSLSALKMICIEQNKFSVAMKQAFTAFSNQNPQILVVL